MRQIIRGAGRGREGFVWSRKCWCRLRFPGLALVWDFGGERCPLSAELASEQGGVFTVAWDVDPAAVEQAWRHVKGAGRKRACLPLIQDLMNPQARQIGWALNERSSLLARGSSGYRSRLLALVAPSGSR